ncbi:hypothetical protein [Halobaculum gomorrense]|uniref:Uncharacterized protein n=1 Tax=Halobaculum gomorrense TaxID=43928 RepID=A0A1M5MTB9_9EURY|nr:hypothetical protein [Halobaculum gomorrense]SHG80382.1 hypothetical protein SAMN05443636_1132 [Halobaculum gomorrense]
MRLVASGRSAGIAGAATAVSAPLSLPVHRTATEWAAALGVAENPVGALLVAFAVVRLLAGTGVCLHGVCAGTGPGVAPGVTAGRTRSGADARGARRGDGAPATTYAPLPSR